MKQGKYTLDLGHQIYLSNNSNKKWSKMIFEQQNQKKFQKKNKFLE